MRLNSSCILNLKEDNGQTIGISQMYVDAKGRDDGIASVKASAPGAETVNEAG